MGRGRDFGARGGYCLYCTNSQRLWHFCTVVNDEQALLYWQWPAVRCATLITSAQLFGGQQKVKKKKEIKGFQCRRMWLLVHLSIASNDISLTMDSNCLKKKKLSWKQETCLLPVISWFCCFSLLVKSGCEVFHVIWKVAEMKQWTHSFKKPQKHGS